MGILICLDVFLNLPFHRSGHIGRCATNITVLGI